MSKWGVGHFILGFISILCILCIFFFVRNTIEIQKIYDILTTTEEDESLSTSSETDSVKHDELIAAHEQEAGTPLSRVARLIIRDEGKRTIPYNDTQGKPTVGVGRSLGTNGLSLKEFSAIVPTPNIQSLLNKVEIRNSRIYFPTLQIAKEVLTDPLTQDDIHLLLTDDLRNTVSEAKEIFPDWSSIEEPRREAITNMLFNLGKPHFLSFHNFIAQVKIRNWEEASKELLKSIAAHENPSRYIRLYKVIETGDAKYFDL